MHKAQASKQRKQPKPVKAKKAVKKVQKRTIATKKVAPVAATAAPVTTTRAPAPLAFKQLTSIATPKFFTAAAFTAPTFVNRRFFSNGNYLQDPKAVEERVLQVMGTFDKIDKEKLTSKAHFQTDLGLDSLDRVEVVLAIEEEFNTEFTDEQSDKFLTVPDVVEFLAKKPDIHLRNFPDHTNAI